MVNSDREGKGRRKEGEKLLYNDLSIRVGRVCVRVHTHMNVHAHWHVNNGIMVCLCRGIYVGVRAGSSVSGDACLHLSSPVGV